MRDYRKHLTLLPHKWQVVGIVASCIVLIPLYYLHYKLSVLLPVIWESQKPLPEYNALVPWANLTNILASVFLMICCLSKEKEEDEYTISVRYRALTIAVIVFFLSRAFGEMIYGGFHRISNGIFSVTFNLPVSQDPIRDHQIGSMGLVVLDRIVGFFSSPINTQLLYLILLKVLKKVGNKTGYDSILLPYRYKKIGWWLLPFSLLLFPLFAFILLYPVKDSTPDAFEEDVAEIDFAEIYSDNNGVKTQVCPTGMKMADYAGTVRDKLILNANGKWEFVQNVGVIADLGDCTWNDQVSQYNRVYSQQTFNDLANPISASRLYAYVPGGTPTTMPAINLGVASGNRIFISKDITSSDIGLDGKIAKLNGVKLWAKLATPITYTNLYYKTGEDTYVPLEDYIPATYVNNWATQSVNTYPYVDGTPVAIPPRITQEFIIDQEESLDTIKGDIIALSENKEDKSNKVTSLSSNSIDVQYPSAKCPYDYVDATLGDINAILIQLNGE